MSYIDGLPPADAVSLTDLFVLDQGGTGIPGSAQTRSATISKLFSQLLSQPIVPPSRLNPALHTPNFNASATPTVCVVGDSTSSLTPNNLVPTDILYYNLTRRIREDNPTKTISFQNFAIGGSTWSNLNGAFASNTPAWYFNTALPWLEFIHAANPTTLYINMGVNDANGFTATQMQQVLAKVVAWGTLPPVWSSGAKTLGQVITDSNGRLQIANANGTTAGAPPVWATTPVGASTVDGTVTWRLLSTAVAIAGVPDIVIITNKNANPNAGAPWNTTLEQAGTIAAASYQRNAVLSGMAGFNIAGLPPIGMIDIGRYFTQVFNGYDPVLQVFSASIPASAPITGITSFPYTLPASPGGDFDLTISLANGSTYTTATFIQITTGKPGSAAGTLIQFQANGGTGGFTSSINNATGTAPTPASFTAAVWLAGTNTIRVTAKGEHILVQLNGAVIWDVLTARFVSNQPPVVQFAGTAMSPVMSVLSYSVGTPRAITPTISAAACFGGGTNGNGINHDASAGINAIDVPVLEATRFGAAGSTATALTNSTAGTMGVTATIIVPFSPTRKWVMITNRSAGSETQDIGSSNVTVGGGIPLAPGGGFLFSDVGACGPIYGITTLAGSPFSYVEG